MALKGERELTKLYGVAQRELQSLLRGIDLESFSGRDSAEIMRKTRRIVKALNMGAAKWADKYLREAYATRAKKTKTALEILGKKPKYTPRRSDSALVEDTIELMVKRNNSILREIRTYLDVTALASVTLGRAQVQEQIEQRFAYSMLETEINRIADEAVAEEWSRGTLAKRLQKAITKGRFVREGGMIQTYEGGAMWSLKDYSKMLSRTTLRDAQSVATEDLCRQYDNDLVEISDHGTDCESGICQDYEGNVYSVTGKTPGYDLIPMWPPFHPNCEHSAHPTSEAAIEAAGRPLGRRSWEEVPDRGHLMRLPKGFPKTYNPRVNPGLMDWDKSVQQIIDDYAARGIKISRAYALEIRYDINSFTGPFAGASERWAQLGFTENGHSVREMYSMRALNKLKRSAERLDDFIRTAPQYHQDRTIWRGFSVKTANQKEYLDMLKKTPIGSTLDMKATSHWSSKLDVAKDFDGGKTKSKGGILFKTKGVKNTTSTMHMNHVDPGEFEVAMASGQKFKIVSKTMDQNRRLIVELEPVGD